MKFSSEVMQVMCNCRWPGNVRELGNCIERIATMTQGNIIRKKDMLCDSDRCFSSVMWQQQSKLSVIPIVSAKTPAEPAARETLSGNTVPAPAGTEAPAPADEFGTPQKSQLIEALEKCGWVQAKAARLLGITPRQIGYAITKYGIDVKRY